MGKQVEDFDNPQLETKEIWTVQINVTDRYSKLEVEQLVKNSAMVDFIYELKDMLRSVEKYGSGPGLTTKDKSADLFIAEIREWVLNELNERQINWD